MDKPSFSASSTMRHCLVITSCPPVLAMCVVMFLGLVLLLEDITLVPKFHYRPALAEREISGEGSTDVIFAKRISKIWKVEDFIVKRRDARPSRRKKNIHAKFQIHSLSIIDRESDSPQEHENLLNERDGHRKDGVLKNTLFDNSINIRHMEKDRKTQESKENKINDIMPNNSLNQENNTDDLAKELNIDDKHLNFDNPDIQGKNRSQEKESKLIFKEPVTLKVTNDHNDERLDKREAVMSFNNLDEKGNNTEERKNIETIKPISINFNHSSTIPTNTSSTINDSAINEPIKKDIHISLSKKTETKSNQTAPPVVSKTQNSDSKEKIQNAPANIQGKNQEAKNRQRSLQRKNRRENRRGRKSNLGDDNSYFVTSNKHRAKLHDRVVNQFKLKDGAQRDSFINLHRYGYIFESQACKTGNPKFAILIHSKFSNFVKRAKIRNTFAKNKTASGVHFAVTFILGKPNIDSLVDPNSREMSEMKREELEKMKQRKYNETMQKLEVESRVFNDIVMGNFTDSYRNLTIKHILAYHWLLKRCKGPGFVLKVDDDILVNTYRIARLVKQAARSSDSRGLLICDVPERHKVIRTNSNKWFVSQEEYPFRFYPPWCKGYGVFMTRDVVKKLYLASSDVRDFWIDDVYVTGILAWRAGIQVRNFRQKRATVTHNQFEPNDIHAMFVWTRFNKKSSHRMYWKAMVAAQENL